MLIYRCYCNHFVLADEGEVHLSQARSFLAKSLSSRLQLYKLLSEKGRSGSMVRVFAGQDVGGLRSALLRVGHVQDRAAAGHRHDVRAHFRLRILPGQEGVGREPGRRGGVLCLEGGGSECECRLLMRSAVSQLFVPSDMDYAPIAALSRAGRNDLLRLWRFRLTSPLVR